MTCLLEQPIDWGACGAAMDFLRCSGCPVMAAWVAVCSFATLAAYLLIAEQWRRSARRAATSDLSAIFSALFLVFVLCGLCHALRSVSVFGTGPATVGYWLCAAVYPALVWHSVKAAWGLFTYGSDRLARDLAAVAAVAELTAEEEHVETIRGLTRRLREIAGEVDRADP